VSEWSVSRRLAAEAFGTAMLVAAVIGSGIMAERLTGDGALTLLGNTIPTGAILVCLITVLGPISGAHFNPAVTLAFWMRRSIGLSLAAPYVAAQIAGGLIGMIAAHLMFDLPPLQASLTARTGAGQWWAEIVATFGLVGMILGGVRFNAPAIPWLVGLYITAAYWFTASTSFANPAVAIARAFTDTFSGIQPLDVPGFVVAELVGAMLAVWFFGWLLYPTPARSARRCANPDPEPNEHEGRMTITIFHNPACGTSRNTLAMIRQSGETPEVIEYLKTSPNRERLVELLGVMGMTPRDLLRKKGTPYAELGLYDPSLSDAQLIEAMLAHPILINRPIVASDKGTKLCRPSETVLDLLPHPDIGPFTKDDGEVVIDAEGRRVV